MRLTSVIGRDGIYAPIANCMNSSLVCVHSIACSWMCCRPVHTCACVYDDCKWMRCRPVDACAYVCVDCKWMSCRRCPHRSGIHNGRRGKGNLNCSAALERQSRAVVTLSEVPRSATRLSVAASTKYIASADLFFKMWLSCESALRPFTAAF